LDVSFARVSGSRFVDTFLTLYPRQQEFCVQKDYLAFFTSLFLSRLADQVLLFIVPLVVFQATHSAAWAGLAFFVESLPRFLAFPVCGALCDRFSPVIVGVTAATSAAMIIGEFAADKATYAGLQMAGELNADPAIKDR
jgi:MFS family permease